MTSSADPRPAVRDPWRFGRRRFLVLGGGLVLAGCSRDLGGSMGAGDTAPGAASSEAPGTTATPGPTTVTTLDPGNTNAPDDRSLVLVQLNGGNDGLNTLVPLAGWYHDARPTLALTDDELIAASGFDGVGWHPALAPLAALADEGRVAAVQGIGFADPDRSHFVSMDRWWRADLDGGAGWLGRWVDQLAVATSDQLPVLTSVALGGGARVLAGSSTTPTTIGAIDAFALPDGLDHDLVLRMAGDTSGPETATGDLDAAIRSALSRAVQAVDAIDDAAGVVGDGIDPEPRPAGVDTSLRDALELAGELVTAGGSRVVVVSTGGFDTHAAQAATHDRLLGELADGLVALDERLAASGDRDRVLIATTSEFGRRVAENGSAGTDHGAAGVSLLVGGGVRPGVHGELDHEHLVDGDLPGVVDPRTLFTACLDWLGADPAAVLGERSDDVTLLA